MLCRGFIPTQNSMMGKARPIRLSSNAIAHNRKSGAPCCFLSRMAGWYPTARLSPSRDTRRNFEAARRALGFTYTHCRCHVRDHTRALSSMCNTLFYTCISYLYSHSYLCSYSAAAQPTHFLEVLQCFGPTPIDKPD